MPSNNRSHLLEEDTPEKLRDRSDALDWVILSAEIFLLLCLFKSSPAWRGALAILLVGAGGCLLARYRRAKEKLYLWISLPLLLIAAALLIWFVLL